MQRRVQQQCRNNKIIQIVLEDNSLAIVMYSHIQLPLSFHKKQTNKQTKFKRKRKTVRPGYDCYMVKSITNFSIIIMMIIILFNNNKNHKIKLRMHLTIF